MKSIYESMKAVLDPRSPRAKKHDLAAVLTYVIAGYLTGHITLRRCIAWCKKHEAWLKKSKRQMVGVSTPKTASKLSAGRITAKTPRGFWQ